MTTPSPPRPLPKGIYTPLPTFFTESEDLDLDSFGKHVKFVAEAGTIPVVAGSAGEAPHLSASERIQLIETARSALSSASLDHVPVVAGVGAPSTRESIQLAIDAKHAGADYAMVIPPGYYAGVLAKDRAALKKFFVDIANASPLPVILYNFPAVSAGIDLDSDLIVSVAKEAPNAVGVKLTCGSVGKVTRINALMNNDEFRKTYPRSNPAQEFRVIDGYIDILLPSIASGAAGAISGLPNIAPKICVRLWELASSGSTAAEFQEAQRLQSIIALADGFAAGIGIPGLKRMVYEKFGYSKSPRRPLLPMSDEKWNALDDTYLTAVLKEEEMLNASA